MHPHQAQANTPSSAQKQALSVSELNRQVKRLLEASYTHILVSGELSSLSRPSSGHWYFTLKDERAQIRCAMFRGMNQRLKFAPAEGDSVVIRGKLSLYEGRGDYQLIADNMEPAGLGQLQAAYEALKLSLAQQGLFDSQHKQAIPKIVRKAAVITSPTGAVIHDILSVSRRRFPAMDIVLVPVKVQGDGAAQEIAEALARVNQQQLADVIIVGRGGGSLEDLWAFNEEVVARAIFQSQIPVVSAVGHEVDFSIADLVADYRAPTPSAAAEHITPDQFELTQTLDQLQRRLQFLMANKLRHAQTSLAQLEQRLKHPGTSLKEQAARISELQQRINVSLRQQLKYSEQRLLTLQTRFDHLHPMQLVDQRTQQLKQLKQQLCVIESDIISEKQHQLSLLANTLHSVSPLATLGRGYAIVGSEQQRVISSVEDVQVGDTIHAQLKDGALQCQVQARRGKQTDA